MKLSDLFGNNIYATEVYYGFSSATFVGASTEANRRDPNNAGHIVITSSPCLFLGAASNSGESTTQPSVLYIHSGTAVKGTFRSTDTAFSSVAPIECLNGLKFSMFNTYSGGPVGNHCLFYKLL
jgi:hypothetical protein